MAHIPESTKHENQRKRNRPRAAAGRRATPRRSGRGGLSHLERSPGSPRLRKPRRPGRDQPAGLLPPRPGGPHDLQPQRRPGGGGLRGAVLRSLEHAALARGHGRRRCLGLCRHHRPALDQPRAGRLHRRGVRRQQAGADDAHAPQRRADPRRGPAPRPRRGLTSRPRRWTNSITSASAKSTSRRRPRSSGSSASASPRKRSSSIAPGWCWTGPATWARCWACARRRTCWA